MYFLKPPKWLQFLYPKGLIWKIRETNTPEVYLTFDDGPHPVATPFVLEQLKKANAKASFFCIGKNVEKYPNIYNQIVSDGHCVGNHTFSHKNGWKTATKEYIEDIEKATPFIKTSAFRPPYGRITRKQAAVLQKAPHFLSIYMWSVLSADFDKNVTLQECLDNVLNNIHPGAIVVMHDSEKAWERLQYSLPKMLEYFSEKGWKMKALPD